MPVSDRRDAEAKTSLSHFGDENHLDLTGSDDEERNIGVSDKITEKEKRESQNGFSLSNRVHKKYGLLERDFAGSIQSGSDNTDKVRARPDSGVTFAANFFNGDNPYSPEPLEAAAIRCEELNPYTTLSESVNDMLFGSLPSAVGTVGTVTGQGTLLAAAVESALTSKPMIEILSKKPGVMTVVKMGMGVAAGVGAIRSKVKQDKKNVEANRTRCRENFANELARKYIEQNK